MHSVVHLQEFAGYKALFVALVHSILLNSCYVLNQTNIKQSNQHTGSHGLGPWYFDMEERLRNPYFLGSRGWNGPIESWVGKNKVRCGLDRVSETERVRVSNGLVRGTELSADVTW